MEESVYCQREMCQIKEVRLSERRKHVKEVRDEAEKESEGEKEERMNREAILERKNETKQNKRYERNVRQKRLTIFSYSFS